MAGRVKEIVDETADKWDIFFVEKENKEERERQEMDKSFDKVYQKDKGKRKIGSIPIIKVTDNIPPPTQDTQPLTLDITVHKDNKPDKENEKVTHDDTNPDYKILFTMNVDTQDINIVVDKETAEVKAADTKNSEISESPTHTVDS